MNEMVERVARAIEAESNYVISQHHSKALARAAIAAMRDPTEAMARAGAVRWHEPMSYGDAPLPYLGDSGAIVWERAIDAALEE